MFFKEKISFVVIAYNREKYIEECMDSILKQDIEKEIICIDDCSTDNTYEILQKYAKKHKEIKLYRNDINRGTVYTRCIGLEKCTGEYMLFVDADDKLIGSYKELYALAKKHKADILEFSSETDGDEELKKVFQRNNEIIDYDLMEAYDNRKITNYLWNKLISKRVYKRVKNLINIDLRQSNFSDVIYFMCHFLMNANRLVKTELKGYFYFDFRGMTAMYSNEERLKQYCGFKKTKNELERVYGESIKLKNKWNFACNQAISVYLDLDDEAKRNNKHILYTLMSEKNVEFLITEVAKIKNKMQKSNQ